MSLRTILCLPLVILLGMMFSVGISGCRLAPKDQPGDTVAASVFAPVDTAALARKARAAQARKDSVEGVYLIGPLSSRRRLQLIAYPQGRDTLLLKRSAKMVVYGNADHGHLVRILTDTIRGEVVVMQVAEVMLPQQEQGKVTP